MIPHNQEFLEGVQMAIQGECQMAAAYVTHGTSLGTLREKIFQKLIRQETPDRFHVETGLIRNKAGDLTSRQCDILIHESVSQAPRYRYEDFVIVHSQNARGVIEVKSALEKKQIGELLDVSASVKAAGIGQTVPIPTFGIGIQGAKLGTVAKHLSLAPKDDRIRQYVTDDYPPSENWPNCIAIQSRGIFGLRPARPSSPNTDVRFCLIDFSSLADNPVGLETGLLLFTYDLLLRQEWYSLSADYVYDWYDSIPVPETGKRWIGIDGAVNKGNMRCQG